MTIKPNPIDNEPAPALTQEHKEAANKLILFPSDLNMAIHQSSGYGSKTNAQINHKNKN